MANNDNSPFQLPRKRSRANIYETSSSSSTKPSSTLSPRKALSLLNTSGSTTMAAAAAGHQDYSFATSPSANSIMLMSNSFVVGGGDLNTSINSAGNSSSIMNNNISQLAYERQLEALQTELQRERNTRRLETVEHEQNENRLKRQVQFLLEETEETRKLLEDHKTQTEKDIEKISKSYSNAIQDLQEADAKILQMQQMQYMQQNDSNEAMFWKQKSDFYKHQLEALQEEMQQLQEFHKQKELRKEDLAANLNTPQKTQDKENNDSMQSSPAPPQIMTELHRTRIELSDTQRQCRMQERKIKDLEYKIQSNKPKLELLSSVQSKVLKLEQEKKKLRKENETNIVLQQNWIQFRKDIDGLLQFELKASSNENIHVVPNHEHDHDNDAKHHPPEIATLVRHFRNFREQLSDMTDEKQSIQTKYNASQERIRFLEQELQEQETQNTSFQNQIKQLEQQLLSTSMEIRKCQAQETISKREANELRSLLETFDLKPGQQMTLSTGKSEKSTTSNTTTASEASSQSLRLSLSLAQEKLKAMTEAHYEIKQVYDKALEEKQSLQTELDRVKEKFGKLREALMQEKEKVEFAEQRACEAEALAGKGSYNTETTRVLHLQTNPLTTALREKYEKEIDALQKEIEQLRATSSISGQPLEHNKTPLGQSSSSSTMSALDAQKLHQRLKESFKEQISLFREGVYLLTGYKVDMIADKDQPLFKVRSMYAEKESDHLIFMWPHKLSDGKHQEVTSLDLLDSELAQELSMTEAFGYMTKFKSIPAFMGSLTLTLFEKQTFMG